MSKSKFAVSLAVIALVAWGAAGTVNSGIVDGTNSTASASAGAVLFCPQGDGIRLDDAGVGATITVVVRDQGNVPIPGIPAADFWLIGSTNGLTLCGGSGSINADSASSNAPTVQGQTTISGTAAAGGCDTGVKVVVQGVVINSVVPVKVTSPDINGDLLVDVLDFGIFGPNFGLKTATGADPCVDFFPSPDGVIDIQDFARFGTHWLHTC